MILILIPTPNCCLFVFKSTEKDDDNLVLCHHWNRGLLLSLQLLLIRGLMPVIVSPFMLQNWITKVKIGFFFFITMFFITNNQSDAFTFVSYILNSINLLLKCLKRVLCGIFFLKRLNGLVIFNLILLNCSVAPPAAAQMGKREILIVLLFFKLFLNQWIFVEINSCTYFPSGNSWLYDILACRFSQFKKFLCAFCYFIYVCVCEMSLCC